MNSVENLLKNHLSPHFLAIDSNIFVVYGSLILLSFGIFLNIVVIGEDSLASINLDILRPVICHAFINPNIETVPTANSRHTAIAKSSREIFSLRSNSRSVGSL